MLDSIVNWTRRSIYWLIFGLITYLYLYFVTKGITGEFVKGADLVGWDAGIASALRTWITLGSHVPYTSQWPLPELTQYENGFEMHHPHFHLYFSYLLFHIFPLKEFTIRLYGLSFFLGSGTLIFLLVKKYWDPRVALSALFVFYMNLPNVIFGTSAHAGYSNMFLCLLFVYLFLEYHRTHQTVYRVLSVIACCWVLMTNWFYYFVPYLFVIFEIWKARTAKNKAEAKKCHYYTFAGLWFVLPFVFLIGHFLYVAHVRHSVNPGEPSPFSELLRTIKHRSGLGQGADFFAAWQPIKTLNRFGQSVLETFPFAVLIFLPFAALAFWRGEEKWTPEKLVVIGFAPVCYFSFILFITIGTYETWAHNSHIALALGICFGKGFGIVQDSLKKWRWKQVLLGVAVLSSSIAFIAINRAPSEQTLLDTYTFGTEPPEVGKYLREITKPGDVIFEDEGGKCVFCWYTNQVSYFHTPVYIMTEFQPKPREDYISYIYSKLKPERNKFLVVRVKNIPIRIDPKELEKRGFVLGEIKELWGWRIYSLKRKS